MFQHLKESNHLYRVMIEIYISSDCQQNLGWTCHFQSYSGQLFGHEQSKRTNVLLDKSDTKSGQTVRLSNSVYPKFTMYSTQYDHYFTAIVISQ